MADDIAALDAVLDDMADPPGTPRPSRVGATDYYWGQQLDLRLDDLLRRPLNRPAQQLHARIGKSVQACHGCGRRTITGPAYGWRCGSCQRRALR